MPNITCTITFDIETIQIPREDIIDYLIDGENFSKSEIASANDETLLAYLQEDGLEEFTEAYGLDLMPSPITIAVASE